MVIYVYYGGHCVVHDQKQIICMDYSEPANVMMEFESMLRSLAFEASGTVKVIAIFDSCSIEVGFVPALSRFFEIDLYGQKDGQA